MAAANILLDGVWKRVSCNATHCATDIRVAILASGEFQHFERQPSILRYYHKAMVITNAESRSGHLACGGLRIQPWKLPFRPIPQPLRNSCAIPVLCRAEHACGTLAVGHHRDVGCHQEAHHGPRHCACSHSEVLRQFLPPEQSRLDTRITTLTGVSRHTPSFCLLLVE